MELREAPEGIESALEAAAIAATEAVPVTPGVVKLRQGSSLRQRKGPAAAAEEPETDDRAAETQPEPNANGTDSSMDASGADPSLARCLYLRLVTAARQTGIGWHGNAQGPSLAVLCGSSQCCGKRKMLPPYQVPILCM